jgi:hypothetical protein
VEEETLVVQQGMERVLVIVCELLWAIVIKSDCKRSANKSNHPIQNQLLLVTEPRSRDSVLTLKMGAVMFSKMSVIFCLTLRLHIPP